MPPLGKCGAPSQKWAVFLYPARREFVDRNLNGPARGIGSAGTGKTVVTMHRALRFAGKIPGAQSLLTRLTPTSRQP